MNGLWGEATPYIVAVYGLTALTVGALIVQSLLELIHWKRRARDLEKSSGDAVS